MAGDDKHSGDDDQLAKNSLLGLKKPYLVILIGLIFTVLVILFICLVKRCSRRRRQRMLTNSKSSLVPMISKEITVVQDSNPVENVNAGEAKKPRDNKEAREEVITAGKESVDSSPSVSGSSSSVLSHDILIGWGRWYSYREIEIATGGFCKDNVIGEGGYGVVYRGAMPDGSLIAIKNLFNNKGQAEQEFKVEVEAIGKVRHKNLVGLIGYCAEGVQRMLIYEYVNNGNLEQWLHGNVGPSSPLTWDIRMKIAIGTAKGLAYLHEGLEPKVVHRDIKASNILLDKMWNPKVSDFGLAKLLRSDASHVTTRVMGTFGYVAPEYANSGRLNEGSDVYSFGVLLMEIISGRSPVDYGRPTGEVNLVDWFKMMVANRRGEEVLDPRIGIQPPPRALKRAFLVCLRCIDWNADKRPKMGQVVHMLEAEDFPYRVEQLSTRDGAPHSPRAPPHVSASTPFLPTLQQGADINKNPNTKEMS